MHKRLQAVGRERGLPLFKVCPRLNCDGEIGYEYGKMFFLKLSLFYGTFSLLQREVKNREMSLLKKNTQRTVMII